MRLPVVPLYARSFGVTTAQIGIINAAFYWVAGLLSLPAGLLADHFGYKRFALVGAGVLAAGMLLLFFSRSYLQLSAVYFLLGSGIALFGPTMMAFVAQIAPATHLGRAYGWYTMAVFGGMGLGPAVGGYIGQWLGLANVFLLATFCALLNFVALGLYLPPHRTNSEASLDLRDMYISLLSILRNRPLRGCWLATFGACLAAGIFFTFMPLHAQHRGLAVGSIGLVFLGQALINAASRVPCGYLSDNVGQRQYLVIVGLLMYTLATMAMGPATAFWHFLAAAIGLGVSMGLAFTSIGALIAETVAPHQRGLAMGGYNTCIYWGLTTGAAAMGPVIDAFGYAASFIAGGLANLLFMVFFFALVRNFRSPNSKRGHRVPQHSATVSSESTIRNASRDLTVDKQK
jgi:MFS family permease